MNIEVYDHNDIAELLTHAGPPVRVLITEDDLLAGLRLAEETGAVVRLTRSGGGGGVWGAALVTCGGAVAGGVVGLVVGQLLATVYPPARLVLPILGALAGGAAVADAVGWRLEAVIVAPDLLEVRAAPKR